MTLSSRERLLALLREFQEQRLNEETFCTNFERVYNLELDKQSLSDAEARAFAALFEEVVWYSPFPDERARVPNYKGDSEIRDAVSKAARIVLGT